MSVTSRLLVAATTALLFLAPFAGSAGLRGAMLVLAVAALLASRRAALLHDIAVMPRAVLVSFCAWGMLATASCAWSELPRYSISELTPEVLYAGGAFFAYFVAADERCWRRWWIALLAGTLVAFAGSILQQHSPFWPSRHPVDGGPGPWSTHLVLVAPLLFALAWPRPWGAGRHTAFATAALALLLYAAWSTENRMVWVALAAQLAVVVVHRARLPSSAKFPGGMLMVAGAVAAVIAFGASVAERSETRYSAKAPAIASIERDLRPRIWSAAWTEFKAAPWLGHGFGREIRAQQLLPVTPHTGGYPPVRHAHNTFIDVALQLGVVGLAAFLALLASLAMQYRRYLGDARLAPLGIIGLAMLAGFVTKNLTDDFLYRHNALVFWALNGMLLGLGRSRPEDPTVAA